MSLNQSLLRDTHILADGVGLLADAGGMSFRKGSVLHRRAGSAFVVAMLIATMSFFIGQARRVPSEGRESGLLPVPVAVVAIALLVWLIRYRPRPLVPITSLR